MKKIEIFERAMNEGGSLKDYGINSTLFAAYRSCLETGNEYIDFNGVIWDYDIPEIIKALKENGISEFTISSTEESKSSPSALHFQALSKPAQHLIKKESRWQGLQR